MGLNFKKVFVLRKVKKCLWLLFLKMVCTLGLGLSWLVWVLWLCSRFVAAWVYVFITNVKNHRKYRSRMTLLRISYRKLRKVFLGKWRDNRKSLSNFKNLRIHRQPIIWIQLIQRVQLKIWIQGGKLISCKSQAGKLRSNLWIMGIYSVFRRDLPFHILGRPLLLTTILKKQMKYPILLEKSLLI